MRGGVHMDNSTLCIRKLLATANEDISKTIIHIFIQLYLYEQEHQEV